MVTVTATNTPLGDRVVVGAIDGEGVTNSGSATPAL